MTENNTFKAGASRRDVLKAAAWSVPVVAVAATAPLAAATTGWVIQRVSDLPLPGEIAVGDTFPLSFLITFNGQPAVAEEVFATIGNGLNTIADWEGAQGQSTVTDLTGGDGTVTFVVEKQADGTFQLTISMPLSGTPLYHAPITI